MHKQFKLNTGQRINTSDLIVLVLFDEILIIVLL